MARGAPLTARPRLGVADIGAWLFTCNPREFGELDAVDGFCARPSYRVGLVRPGQPAVLWVSGPEGAAPAPGIWMVGRTTGAVRDGDGRRPRVGLALRALAEPVARAELRADPRTARMEVLRAPQMGNPSVVTPAELAAIAELVDDWP
ncbi:hypothetical protein [Pseudonocardia humida]|uniref:EVE domain-containing protein n=1 Tax=Pseudonocardia humida TaxID=2800819 RepID=A0ABT1A9R6_9PSEU|nr:hypothetical protein [Pseudonocardia humida]MCO1659564.1 hypothetical protein [Pseudonocardia humida]